MTNHPNRSQRPYNPKMTMAEVLAFAARSGFEVAKINGVYRLVETDTGRLIVNRDGTFNHKNAAELYESLTERT